MQRLNISRLEGGLVLGPALRLGSACGLSRALRPGVLATILVLVAGSSLLAQRAPSWQRRGPEGGNVIALDVEADGTVFLGTADGHVFASTDQGEHWEIRGRVGARQDAVVQRIVPDKAAPARLLAAVWNLGASQGGGVFESLDSGRHWTEAGLTGESVRALEHSASDTRRWVAGTRSGVFLSQDNAHSWKRISRVDDPELQNVDSLAIDPTDPQTIYVGTYHLPWKTMDGGNSWRSIASGMIDDSDVMSLRIDVKNPRRIFSSACSGIYRSENAGDSWVKLQGIPYRSRRTHQIVQSSSHPSELYAATTAGLWRTEDAGESWTRVGPGPAVVNAILVVDAESGQRVLAGTEEGIFRSDDHWESFTPSNAGFAHPVISAIAADTSDPNHLLARVASVSTALLETRDAGRSWNAFAAQPANPPQQLFATASGWWATYAEGGLARFDAKKQVWRELVFREFAPRTVVGPRSTRRATTRTFPIAHPKVVGLFEWPDKLVVASTDGLWEKKLTETRFRRAKVANLPKPIAYVSRNSQSRITLIAANELWQSDLTHSAWTKIPLPRNAGDLLWAEDYLTTSGVLRFVGTRAGIYRLSGDASWQRLAGGLPAIGSKPIALSGPDLLVAASNGGIYRSDDWGNTWTRMDTWSEQGPVVAILSKLQGQFLVVSQSEGALALPEK